MKKALCHVTIPSNVQLAIDAMKRDGLTLVLVADETKILGMFGIADEIREESESVIKALHQAGIKNTVMLTGDHEKTARKWQIV